MGKTRPVRVFVIMTVVVLLAACARPKPSRTVEAPPLQDAAATSVTAAVATPTEAPTEEPAPSDTGTEVEPTVEPADAVPTATEMPPTPTSEPTQEPTAEPTMAPTATEMPPAFPYRVQSGDTLGGIATRFGVTARSIAELNNLPSTQIVRLGQTLLIPGEAPEPPSAPGTVEYRVRAGETLSLLALRHRTSTAAILRMNPSIGSPEQLRAGALITIPIGTEAPVTAHTLAEGETLASIAQDYDVSTQSIMSLNAITDAGAIEPGQVIFIPQ